jgi:hypothetical protein
MKKTLALFIGLLLIATNCFSATDFPTSLSSYTTKLLGDTVSETHVNNLQSAIVALEAKVGVNSSATTTSHDYKLSSLTKFGSFTRDISTASGDVAYTGVGFQPSAIIFLAVVPSTKMMSSGIDVQSAHGVILDDGNETAGDWYNSESYSIYLISAAGSSHTGVILSFDADGFTVRWAKIGTPTGTATIYYLALR